MLTGKIPNAAIGIKISLFQQEPGKIDPRSGNFIVVKGYVIPFLHVPAYRIIPKQVTMPKTQELLTDQEIMEVLEKEAIKNCNIISQINF